MFIFCRDLCVIMVYKSWKLDLGFIQSLSRLFSHTHIILLSSGFSGLLGILIILIIGSIGIVLRVFCSEVGCIKLL